MCPESLLKLTTFACSDFGYPELLKNCKRLFQSLFISKSEQILFEPEWPQLSLKALKAILDFNVYPFKQEQLLLAVKRWEEANAELVSDSEMAEVYRKIRFPNIRISTLKEIMNEKTHHMPETTKIVLWISKCKRIMKTYSTQSNVENEEKKQSNLKTKELQEATSQQQQQQQQSL